MAEIIVVPKLPSHDVICILEQCLERARCGDVHGVVVIQSWGDNATDHTWAGVKDNGVRIVGELMIAVGALSGNIDRSRE